MEKSELLQKVKEAFSNDGIIDIVAFAKDTLKIPIYEDPDMKELAVIHCSKNKNGKYKYYIDVNPNTSIERRRFSIAHELAHFVLHQDILKQVGSMAREDKKKALVKSGKKESSIESENSKIERAADELAADMLMPADILDALAEKHGVKKDEYIYDPYNFSPIQKLAEELRVSLNVCIERMRDLKYNVTSNI